MGITTHLGGVLDQLEAELRLSNGQLATTVGTTSRTLERWRTGESFPQRESRHRLDELIALSERLHDTFATPEAVSTWLRTNSTYLASLKPVGGLQIGRVDRVLAAIEALDSGAFLSRRPLPIQTRAARREPNAGLTARRPFPTMAS